MRLNLNRYLERQGVSAYRVVKETTGKLAPNTVYDLARKPAQRIDLQTVGEVMTALERITGEAVTFDDLLELVPTDVVLADEDTGEGPTVDLAVLLANAAKHAKVRAGNGGKVEGSVIPAKITGKGPSVVEIIRQGRR